MLDARLSNHFPRFEGVRLSMVADANLLTFGNSETSRDVSTPLDRALLLEFRRMSDLVITDAATASAEGYKQSKIVEIEIWTKTGNFRGIKNEAATDELHALGVVQIEDESKRLHELLQLHKSILLETGLTLSAVLAKKKLIDEACISITAAASETKALVALEKMQAKIGLGYLNQQSHVWLDMTLFARLER